MVYHEISQSTFENLSPPIMASTSEFRGNSGRFHLSNESDIAHDFRLDARGFDTSRPFHRTWETDLGQLCESGQ
jgi:hypothetical protein